MTKENRSRTCAAEDAARLNHNPVVAGVTRRKVTPMDFPETDDGAVPEGPRVLVSDVFGPRGPVVRLTFEGRSVDIVGWHGRAFDGFSALLAGRWYRRHPRAAFEAWANNA